MCKYTNEKLNLSPENLHLRIRPVGIFECYTLITRIHLRRYCRSRATVRQHHSFQFQESMFAAKE